MAADQEFSVKGPICKLAMKHGSEAVRHVAGKKPKTLEMTAVEALVAKGVYDTCRFAPKKWFHAQEPLERWILGEPGGADFVEFMAPQRAALASMRQTAQAVANPANPPKALVKKLLDAIEKGRIDEVKSLAPLAARGSFEEESPLIKAASWGKPDAVAALLPHCDPLAFEEYSGKTALMSAMDSPTSALILLPVSDIKAVTASGQTALMFASSSERVDSDLFEIILAASDPGAVDKNGWTALMHAAQWGQTGHVEMLLPVSDATVKDSKGRDALAIVIDDDYWTRSMVTDHGKVARFRRCVEHLIDVCDLNWRSEAGKSVSAILAELGMSSAIKKLAARGELSTELGADTPLIAAARAGRFDTMETLLRHSDPNAKGKDGDTALIVAARDAKPASVRLLLPKTDANIRNDAGRTALTEALLAKPGRSYQAETEANEIRCALQLRPKTDLDLRDAEGCTALMRAMRPGSLELFELILQKADPDIRDDEGRTALMKAATFRRDLDEFAELLAPRSDLTLRGPGGLTALMAHEDNPKMVRMLLAGSEVDARDDEGHTALMRLAGSEYAGESVALLVAVSDARLRDPSGKSALDLAREAGHEKIAALIEARVFELETPTAPAPPTGTTTKKRTGL